jgi:hypothetical protein
MDTRPEQGNLSALHENAEPKLAMHLIEVRQIAIRQEVHA